ncbi:MAG: hypothetical protein ACRCTU_08260, partial [Zoogloea sp.]|uniref:hypothetical protein n=1 Tax=Zoogloea sp. TaxID=49181 RepID=UPI003F3CD1B4
LKQALADDRSMSDALSALSSWGSFQADAERMAPFYAEAASAKSPQELEAIAKKYQSVIGSGRTAMVVSLSFDAKGNVSLQTNS